MNRESINPWDWGLKWSMDQGELVTGVSRYLHFSGQVALEPDPDSETGVTVVSPAGTNGIGTVQYRPDIGQSRNEALPDPDLAFLHYRCWSLYEEL